MSAYKLTPHLSCSQRNQRSYDAKETSNQESTDANEKKRDDSEQKIRDLNAIRLQ